MRRLHCCPQNTLLKIFHPAVYLLVWVPEPLFSLQCQKFFTAVLLRPGSRSLAIAAWQPAAEHSRQNSCRVTQYLQLPWHRPCVCLTLGLKLLLVRQAQSTPGVYYCK